jgi:hypothetical protein
MRRVDGYMKASVCSIDLSNNVPYNVFRHGYLEARSRVPVGKGAWSAFWLGSEYHARNWEWPHLPALSGRDRHPRDAQQRAAHAIHDAAPQCERQVWSPRRDASGDALDALRHRHDALQSQTEFHVYAVKWTPDRVPWFREGKVVQSTRYHSTIADVSSFDSTDQPSLHRLEYMAVRVGRQLP